MGTNQQSIKEEPLKKSRLPGKSADGQQVVGTEFPPPKTDKPRPHVCTTCMRGFARLEHLKRHERSHTKEKPFACEQCTRCFARRDLLLRHQQKLHQTAPPAARARGRRESTNSIAPGGSSRVRKNSMASNNGGLGSMRPRANTISHIDNSAMDIGGAGGAYGMRTDALGLTLANSIGNGLPGVGGYHFRGMSTASGQHGHPHVLPKLETRHRDVDTGTSLRTAPVFGNFGNSLNMSMAWNQQPGSTVNPAQLHFATSPHNFGFESPGSPFNNGVAVFGAGQGPLDCDESFPWLTNFEHQMSFNEQAIDTSTPSESDGSPDGGSEMMLDNHVPLSSIADAWSSSNAPHGFLGAHYGSDATVPSIPESYSLGQLSPKSINTQFGTESMYATPPPLASHGPPSLLQGLGAPAFQPTTGPQTETPTNSAASTSSSHRMSSVTSLSSETISDITRNALLTSLSRQSLYGFTDLKTSQPQVMSNVNGNKMVTPGSVPLPSTSDLQRYVGAYIQYFHPHLPFLHTASLSFDSPAFTCNLQASRGTSDRGRSAVAGGGGALILAMAAIGALYTYDFGPSKDLFDMSRTMIRLYTAERRKAELASGQGPLPNSTGNTDQKSPLWLVQAMLLNVIYGHNCGDKIAAGIASNLCGTVVNLARSAQLAQPSSDFAPTHVPSIPNNDVEMTGAENETPAWDGFSPFGTGDVQSEWLFWRKVEERKRTLYAVFILSSLLVSAYNHAPALTNSEIRLDLPCDEILWAAESAETWKALGGSVVHHDVSFATALTSLLTAHQRQGQNIIVGMSHTVQDGGGIESFPSHESKPSTFGCLVLINALHNYIWETRQRHLGSEWSVRETEAMHARIEPALRTWQAAWSLNPEHSLERPNPFGASSLSADCIPLLDLAYLRLFVNLGRSKEAFFQRDWDSMADELAYGAEIVQHADASPDREDSSLRNPEDGTTADSEALAKGLSSEADSHHRDTISSIRERHLRKAAFYAANSLTLSNNLGVTFADFNSRELPLQSALCAFDCAQVLAEWISLLQQRIGPHTGILCRSVVDSEENVPPFLLEKDDKELVGKIDDIVSSLANKINYTGEGHPNAIPSMDESDFGSKLLLIHAAIFESAPVWPLMKEMSQSLRIQAAHIHAKALASISSPK